MRTTNEEISGEYEHLCRCSAWILVFYSSSTGVELVEGRTALVGAAGRTAHDELVHEMLLEPRIDVSSDL